MVWVREQLTRLGVVLYASIFLKILYTCFNWNCYCRQNRIYKWHHNRQRCTTKVSEIDDKKCPQSKTDVKSQMFCTIWDSIHSELIMLNIIHRLPFGKHWVWRTVQMAVTSRLIRWPALQSKTFPKQWHMVQGEKQGNSQKLDCCSSFVSKTEL